MYASLSLDNLRSEVLQLERLTSTNLKTIQRLLGIIKASSFQDKDSQSKSCEELSMELNNAAQRINKLVELYELMTDRATTIMDDRKLQIHQNNLKEFRQEFQSLEKSALTYLQTKELFGEYDLEATKKKQREGMSGTEHLLRERGAIESSERRMGELFEKSLATKEMLAKQQESIFRIQNTTSKINEYFPALGKLMENISKRKKANELILGIWIGLLICIFLYYVVL